MDINFKNKLINSERYVKVENLDTTVISECEIKKIKHDFPY